MKFKEQSPFCSSGLSLTYSDVRIARKYSTPSRRRTLDPLDDKTTTELKSIVVGLRSDYDGLLKQLAATDGVSASTLELLHEVDGRLMDVERTLYGHPDPSRKITEPGVVATVTELNKAFLSVQSVARAGWALIGLVGVGTVANVILALR